MEEVVAKLDNIHKTLEGIRQILGTPENKIMTVLKYVGAVVSAISILTIVEVINSLKAVVLVRYLSQGYFVSPRIQLGNGLQEDDMIYQLILAIITFILGLVIFFLARKYEKHQPDLKSN